MALKDIVDEIAFRVSAIKVSAGYNTDIGKSIKRRPVVEKIEDAPVSGVYLYERQSALSSNGGKRTKTEPVIVVEGAVSFTGEPLDAILEMMADIQKAVEIEPQDLDGLLQGDGLVWAGDEYIYPSETSNAVGVAVTYEIPHLRFYGDPTKPEVN